MYADEIATVKAVLIAYPDVLGECKYREDFILSTMSGSSCDEDVRVQGGTSISPGDKYLTATEKDKRLVRVRTIKKAVKSGLKQLNRRELDTITAVYFKKMKYARASEEVGISVGYLSHVIEMAMLKLAEYCIPVYPLVCQYRTDVEQRKNEVLKQESVASVG